MFHNYKSVRGKGKSKIIIAMQSVVVVIQILLLIGSVQNFSRGMDIRDSMNVETTPVDSMTSVLFFVIPLLLFFSLYLLAFIIIAKNMKAKTYKYIIIYWVLMSAVSIFALGCLVLSKHNDDNALASNQEISANFPVRIELIQS